ncbi:MAG: formimidoylglutamate deiminase, partial [Woeseiaceae bacterium]|nr:formimidoylglutamate deiminase [Woeseiaceae bacterium]
MTTLFARRAWTSDGWRRRVRVTVAGERVATVAADARPQQGDEHCDILLPGLANAHSHAFQRALAGRTEQRGGRAADTFWTWREQMYRLAGRLDASTLRGIAAQLYAELLVAGYTRVVEFHYLLGGDSRDDDAAAMLEALVAAADDAGMRLVYVPVLYERRDFDDDGLDERQRRFHLPLERFFDHHAMAREALGGRHAVGIGAHSLRAVSARSLQELAGRAREDGAPFHLHVAEQRREVDACLAATGKRPVQWLLDHAGPGDNWTLVHATHLDADETARLAASGAVVCLCPGTEGNLGDGFFRLADYLQADGSIAIGSDSQVTIDPMEELRWLEYGQRLREERRNVAAGGSGHSGTELLSKVVDGGARSAGERASGLASGAPADFIALDGAHPSIAGHG